MLVRIRIFLLIAIIISCKTRKDSLANFYTKESKMFITYVDSFCKLSKPTVEIVLQKADSTKNSDEYDAMKIVIRTPHISRNKENLNKWEKFYFLIEGNHHQYDNELMECVRDVFMYYQQNDIKSNFFSQNSTVVFSDGIVINENLLARWYTLVENLDIKISRRKALLKM